MTGEHEHGSSSQPCCCDHSCLVDSAMAVSRRHFLTASGIAVSMAAMGAPAVQSALAGAATTAPAVPGRRALVVKPVLSYETPTRRPQTSWRNWGGIQTREHAAEELARIAGELDKLKTSADFPITVLPPAGVRNGAELEKLEDLGQADAVIIYAAGGPSNVFDAALKTGKHVIIFLRHRSGPVYLWYEIVSPRYLRRHTDHLAVKGIDNGDVVVDSVDELAWRLRALCGLKNALGTKIVAIGGAGGWETPNAPELAKAKWKLDIHTVSYAELRKLLAAAMEDQDARKLAADRAARYLADPLVKLETDRSFVENAFVLEQVFRSLMNQAGATAITVNHCMGTIMPMSRTTACLTLSLLNDDGYLAFCESDFVVIPAGILLSNIAGRPNFLNDPTYPHAGVITLAHCTAPRRLDGKNLEPVRVMTHFESDYGAAPKVEMRKGQVVTNVIPDFAAVRYVGLLGEIVDAPLLDICRSQIDVAYKVPDDKIALNMPGFHWETIYGDWTRETGYALKKIPIAWTFLG